MQCAQHGCTLIVQCALTWQKNRAILNSQQRKGDEIMNKSIYEAEANLIKDFVKETKFSWKSLGQALAISVLANRW